jgi:hypothetical protein
MAAFSPAGSGLCQAQPQAVAQTAQKRSFQAAFGGGAAFEYEYLPREQKPLLPQKAPMVGAAPAPEKTRGLRHFSSMVCAKVREKGQTTYNEVFFENFRFFLWKNRYKCRKSASSVF